ncbi:MAG: hypothetical protein AAF602_10200, partial [Myxococcota bacterium]
GDLERAVHHANKGAEAHGDEGHPYPYLQAGCHMMLALARVHLGHPEGTAGLAARALDEMRALGHPAYLTILLLDGSDWAWLTDRPALAVDRTRRAAALLPANQKPGLPLLRCQLRAALHEQCTDEADSLASEVERRVTSAAYDVRTVLAWATLAVWARARGRPREAARWYDRTRSGVEGLQLLPTAPIHRELEVLWAPRRATGLRASR